MPSGLVVGAEGLLGGALLAELRASGWETMATARRMHGGDDFVGLDLADRPEGYLQDARLVGFLTGAQVSAFLLAAVTGYERCEKDPLITRTINVDHTVALAKQLVQRGAFLSFPSSSAVFGGAESEARSETASLGPGTEYGRQKADVERAMTGLMSSALEGAGAAIVRIAKVVHGGGRFGEWTRDLARGVQVEAARDLMIAPVSMRFVVTALRRLGERRESGTFHVSGEREVSYFEFVRMLAGALGFDTSLVYPTEVRSSLGARGADSGRLQVGEPSRRAGLRPQPLDAAIQDLVSEFQGSR